MRSRGLAMGLIKYKIGQLIEQVNETNSELRYGKRDVMGMTITKEIIPTKANLDNTKLDNYLIVRPNEFIYNPRTHGAKIGFGFNDSTNTILISWNNIAFRISKLGEVAVLPEYLFMHFNRAEWDRDACFRSWGSSTEVFSWDALCDMDIILPDIPTQQKYVDIYNGLKKNIEAYKSGINDLRKTCRVYIDNIKGDSEEVPIGKCIGIIDERNEDNYDYKHVGINRDKKFMSTAANTASLNGAKYKIIRKNRFVFSGMQTGRDKCVRIGLYSNNKPSLISPAYATFEITSEKVLAEYLFLLFLNPEMDRLGWFLSDGSIRSNLDWDRFCEIKIALPDIEIQKDIIAIYNSYDMRLNILERLLKLQKLICPILVKGALEEA